MDQWSEIRRRVLTGELTRRAACREYKVHWQTLEKMLAMVEPPGYRRKVPKPRPKIDPFVPIIHEILKSDQQVHKKQRHTAQRIFDRLKDEHGYAGGYTIVKDVVRAWKATSQEVFLPLSHPPGEAQVDFGFAQVTIAGKTEKVAFFVMTLPYSDAIFCQVFHRECTEVFLEGHKRAFEYFGGVPRKIRYDNSKIAVSKITGSRDRQVSGEFLRLQSHYLFQEEFCLVRRANEKGHVETLLGFARRNYLVPVPNVNDLAELNERLLHRCRQDLQRTLRGKPGPKQELLLEDRAAMLALPSEEFEARRVESAIVDSLSLAHFDTNTYSVPTKYAHRQVMVIATVDEVRFVFEDQLIARHPRCWQRDQPRYNPIHYLALLERKPGGFDFAKPLEGWELPAVFTTLRRRMEAEGGLGTREFIRVLRLLERASLEELTDAVDYALDLDIADADSIRVILEHRRESPVALFSLDGRPHLKVIQVEPTNVGVYQSLLTEDESSAE
jgi:transposase